MNVKDYLSKVKLYDNIINTIILERDELRSKAEKCTSAISSAGKCKYGNTNDIMAEYAAKLADSEGELNKAILSYLEYKRDVNRNLEKLTNPTYYSLLHLHYIQYKKFTDIADVLNYNMQSLLNMHGKALKEFSKVLDKKNSVLKQYGAFLLPLLRTEWRRRAF